MTNSTISGNYSRSRGGGIGNYGTATVTNSTISGNSSGNDGGGIYNTGTATVANSTISGNSADDGGGIYNYGTATVANSTISGNSALRGGGIFSRYNVALSNTIVSGSTNGGDLRFFGIYGGSFSGSNNLIQDVSNPGNGLTNSITGDPMLGPLADNGGPTLTHALVAGSPAIDAGDNTLATALTTDQRGTGFARIIDGTVDIGAFEAPVMLDTEVTLDAGVLTITDIDGTVDNEFVLTSDGTTLTIVDDSGATIDVSSVPGSTGQGTSTVTVPYSAAGFTGAIIINGAGGDDSLEIDYSNGTNFDGRAITFNGQGQNNSAGGDALVLTGGGSFAAVDHVFTNANDGEITIDATAAANDELTITYTGLEPIDDNLAATDRTFTFNGGAETITLVDAAGTDLTLDSTRGESVTFAEPTGSITINAGTGDVDVNAVTLGADIAIFGSSITVGGLNAGANDVTLTAATAITGGAVDGSPELTAGIITLNTGASGIGVSGTPLELSASNRVDATTTAPSADFFITSINDLRLGRLDAGAGTIQLTAAGSSSIQDATSNNDDVSPASGSFDLIGSDIDLSAGGGIGDVQQLELLNPLTIKAIAQAGGVGLNVNAGSDLTLTDVRSNGEEINIEVLSTGTVFAQNMEATNAAVDLTVIGGAIEVSSSTSFGGTSEVTLTATDILFAEDVSGNYSLTLSHSGTATFATGTTSDFTGTTTLTSGLTVVNGTLDNSGGTVTVQTGATLGGSGVVNRPVTVQSGGTLNPGNSPGILTAGDFTLGSGTLQIEVDGVTTAGTDYDQLAVTGTVNLTDGTLDLVDSFAGTADIGDTLTIIDNDTTADAVTGVFATLVGGTDLNGGTLAEGDAFSFNDQDWQISYIGGDGNDVVITVAVPETPSLLVTVATDTLDAFDNQTSLREAIIFANQTPNTPDEITFSNTTDNGATNFHDADPDVITLNSGQLTITSDITIAGPGADLLTVSGNDDSRVFDVIGSSEVTFDSLTIADGHTIRTGNTPAGSRAEGAGIRIDTNATVSILDSVITGNKGTEPLDGGIYGLTGGGIFNRGTLSVMNSTVSGNTAQTRRRHH